MSKVTAVKILKENFYNRIDKHDEVQFLDSSTLNHALCLEIAESTFATLKQIVLVPGNHVK